MQRAWLLACLSSFLITPEVRGQQSWVGEVVMPKRNAALKVGSETVDDNEAVYVIQQEQEDWLWTGNGWIHQSSVVRLANAPEYYTQVIRENRRDAWAYNMRGVAWTNQRKFRNAVEDFSVALQLDRNDASTYANRGAAWLQQGDYQRAVDDLTQAIRLKPDHAAAYSNRGLARMFAGDLDAAMEDFTEAIRLNPDYAAAYSNRGECWERKGKYEQALNAYTKAIELESRFASPYALRARLWAACPDQEYRDGAAAVQSATTACELTGWKNALYIDTLAAAYAEADQFDEAVQWQERAIELSAGSAPEEFQDRWELYKQQQPYRMTGVVQTK